MSKLVENKAPFSDNCIDSSDGGYIDLHTHSTASDGTFTPAEVACAARMCGLKAAALTDHDTTGGIEEFLKSCADVGIEAVPGVELSTDYHGSEIHVVGLYIDHNNNALLSQLKAFRDNRDHRNDQIIELLKKEGFNITSDDVGRENPDTTIARPHIARYLVDTGQLEDVQTAFDNYLAEGRKCFVDRMKISPFEAVDYIHNASGIAILAHPCLYKKLGSDELEELIAALKDCGLEGMETIYSRNKPGDEDRFRALAKKYSLLESGGSDFHGANKPDISIGTGTGNMNVPYSYIEKIRAIKCL